jgi:hypothetical protein
MVPIYNTFEKRKDYIKTEKYFTTEILYLLLEHFVYVGPPVQVFINNSSSLFC